MCLFLPGGFLLSYLTPGSAYVLYALTTGNVCGEITGGLRVAIDG